MYLLEIIIAGHSRTIIGIEQRSSGMQLLILDPSHGPRQVAALGSSQDSLRLIRRNSHAMRAPQYQIGINVTFYSQMLLNFFVHL